MLKNWSVSAGDKGLLPDRERCHMTQSNKACVPQLLSLCSGAQEPQQLRPHAANTEARGPRAQAPQQEKPPR